MKKKEALNVWKLLRDMGPVNPLDRMEAIPCETRGSKYGCDQIRITGSHGFVNAVLSCLTDLIDGENEETRLNLVRQEIRPSIHENGYDKELPNAEDGSEAVYISLQERGATSRRRVA